MSEVLVKDLHEFLQATAAKQNLELSTDRDIWKAEAERMTSGYDAAQSELAALREELADTADDLDTVTHHNIDLQFRNIALLTLLGEVLNEVPHGWGESFTDSDLAERIRQATQPTESGASE